MSRMLCSSSRMAARPASRPCVTRVGLGSQLSRRSVVMYASDKDGKQSSKPSAREQQKLDRVIEELKKTGMTAAKARQILKSWTDSGVNTSEELKQLLIKRSTAPIPALLFQAVLDSTACFGGFYLADLASKSGGGPLGFGVEFLGYAFGIYYFVQVLLEFSVISGLLYTTYKYGTNSSELLAAVQTMAGPVSGVGLVDQATRAVNIFKVVSALEAVATLLRDEYANPPKGETLRNLGAYLTLSQARESLGFKPEEYGLTDKEAGNIAYAFATYDTNQNYKLEPSELRALCSSLGKDLDEAEIKEAVKLLDGNKNGYIEFNEFVAWWVKLNDPSKSLAASKVDSK